MLQRLTLAVLLAAAVAACGKRGNPLPPLRPVPARIADATLVRTGDRVAITFTVPDTNLDGTTPVAIGRVDLFAWRGEAGAAIPAAGVIAGERRHLRSNLVVTQATDESTAPGAADLNRTVPGTKVTVWDTLSAADLASETVAYVVVPVAGSGRGRPGPPSVPLAVPVASLPEAPTGLALTHDEKEVQVTWDAGAPVAGTAFEVLRVGAGGVVDEAIPPINAPAPGVTWPVEFGRELCVAVRPVVAAGRVTTIGPLSNAACLTPVDRYPPQPPAGFQAVQEGTSVLVSWTAVEASDLAGYIVLRGVGSGDNLQPLMREAITETTYRDVDVRPGETYFYAVYARDRAEPANVSQLSNRQSVTVR